MPKLILTINPGSTSTKLALFDGEMLITQQTMRYDSSFLASFNKLSDQLIFRTEEVQRFLVKHHIEITQLAAIVGRGGLLKPLPHGGTYLVNDRMLLDLKQETHGKHAANLGAQIAYRLGSSHNIPCYVVNPVVVDELRDEARISGHPNFPRKSIYHALNQKAIAMKHAQILNRSYSELTLIVAHLGGGISVGLHHKGRTIDVNNALGGEGPLSPERSGTLPAIDLIDAAFSGKYTHEQLTKMIIGNGGLMAHLDTNNAQLAIDLMIFGNPKASQILKGMCYQIAKEISALHGVSPVAVDAILITGGLAYNQWIIDTIKSYLRVPTELIVYPGEDEMLALAQGALRVIDHQEEAYTYGE